MLDDRLAAGSQDALKLTQVVEDVPVLEVNEHAVGERRVRGPVRKHPKARTVRHVVDHAVVLAEPRAERVDHVR